VQIRLNKQPWYRFIKVVYLSVFALTIIVSVFVVYDENKSKWFDDYIITCQYGNKTVFSAQKEESIYLNDYDLKNGISSIPDHTKEKIQKVCGISQEEIQNMIAATLKKDGFVPALFRVEKGTIEINSKIKAIGYSLLDILIVALIFEILRRIFYYIILGSLRPQK